MKIAVAATGMNKTDLTDSRFGRGNYFQIYDTETTDITSVENEAKNADGGAGIAAAQQIIDLGVDVLISWKVGPNAYKLFNKAGIKMFSSECKPVEKVFEDYNNGLLKEIEGAGPAHHGS